MANLKQVIDEVRDGYVRIKLLSEQAVAQFPEDEVAKETLSWVTEILNRKSTQ